MGVKKIFITLLVILLLVSPVTVEAAVASDIANKLICQCGCEMTLSKCKCFTDTKMTTVIEQKVAQGQSEEQIIQYFIAQYGEQVLASPPKWLLPIAILVGGGVIYIALRKWVWPGGGSPLPWNSLR